jgi:hypothetical protein
VTGRAVAAEPRVLAQLLLAHLQEAELVSLEDLSTDPIATLEASPAVRITWVEPASLPATCSIAAACDKSSEPARLLVSNADFRTGISALGSGEFEVELASAPPGDGGVGGQVGVAQDG